MDSASEYNGITIRVYQVEDDISNRLKKYSCYANLVKFVDETD